MAENIIKKINKYQQINKLLPKKTLNLNFYININLKIYFRKYLNKLLYKIIIK